MFLSTLYGRFIFRSDVKELQMQKITNRRTDETGIQMSRKKNSMTDLKQTRAEVDKIDREIARLFEARMQLTDDIAEYKLRHGIRVVDQEREEEMLRELV